VGLSLIEGREFTAMDRLGSNAIAIVSRTLADQLWPDRSPLGNPVRIVDDESRETRTVVGVVKDVRQGPTDQNLADLYIPLLQAPGRFAGVIVRGDGSTESWPKTLREVLRQIDPEVALNSISDVQGTIDAQLARPRFLASLLAGFSAFALMLALIGVYGVVAYAVKQREHEIAVRMAVGAAGSDVTRLFIRQAGVLLLCGIALGLAGATAIGQLFAGQLHGVRPLDPLTLAAMSLLIVVVCLAATWWPARSAASTDPIIALRQE
jgi:predicted lysophospholipase L1 biosynthesis ABC-type transport system permease subunit